MYYEWDRLFLIPFTLIGHETPVLDGTGSWIAYGWTLEKLQFLYVCILALVYNVSIFLSMFWVKRTGFNATKKFVLAVSMTSGTLFMVALVFTFNSSFIRKNMIQLFSNNPIKIQIDALCVKPTEKDRIYFGGNGFDYISSGDGANLKKIWQKPGSSGFPSGIPSPDGSRIAYAEREGVWIRCTDSAGQYLIPFPSKNISGLNKNASDLAWNISWSPDSIHFVLNYGGDLIKVNTNSKEKTLIYKSIALKDFQIDPIRLRPSGFLSYYQTGYAYWLRDNSIIYTKFIGDQVELRRLYQDGTDALLLSNSYPMYVGSEIPDENVIVVHEGNWLTPDSEYHYDEYYFDLSSRLKRSPYYGVALKTGRDIRWSSDGIYATISTPRGAIDTNNNLEFQVISLHTQKSTNLKDVIKTYLKDQNLWDGSGVITVEFRGWSSSNQLLIYIMLGFPAKGGLVLTSDSQGKEIKVIYNKGFNYNKSDQLFPENWLGIYN